MTPLWILAALWGCTADDPAPPEVSAEGTAPDITVRDPSSVTRREGPAPTAVALARLAERAEVQLAPHTRPDATPVPTTFSPRGRPTQHSDEGEVIVWALPLPVDPALFPDPQAGARSFGNYDPPGLEVTLRGRPLRFVRRAVKPNSFGYDHDRLLIGLPTGVEPPQAEEVSLTWPKATDAERALHADSADLRATEFAHRRVVVDRDAHTGVLLPAPSTATYEVTVPADGVLASRVRLLPPAIRTGVQSDGARVVVSVSKGGGPPQPAGSTTVGPDWTDLRADLSRWAGQTVAVTLSTAPGDTATGDLVFLEDPTIYTPTDDPKRVVVLYWDTVRADHLTPYGYERPTTPWLGAWAEDALVAEQARSVAPWTLPSARAVMTGDQPEAYFDRPTLPEHLARAGFYTDGIVANAFLSPVFEMDQGFAHYRYRHLLPAHKLVDHALEVIDRHPDRDVMVWVQFMEAHLPYMEPPAYRDLFAGAPPDGLRLRRDVLVRKAPDDPELPAIRQHVIDRYDQNLRVLDDQTRRLVEAVGDGATVVMLSDHGEEFWDHDGYEHGHTFYDELLEVPLILRDPHLPPSRLAAPTSLLDVTPTVLELQGLPVPDGLPGRSLVDAAFGEDGAVDELASRPQAFGRPLYGADGWGVLHEGHKWWSRGGVQRLYDVADDPGETVDQSTQRDLSAFPAHATAALGRPVQAVWRVTQTLPRPRQEQTLTFTHPSGFEAAWLGYDPRAYSTGATAVVDDAGRAVITVPAGVRVPAQIHLDPAGPPEEVGGLTVRLEGAGQPMEATTTTETVTWGPKQEVFLGPVFDRRRLKIDTAWVPVPGGTEVSGFHPEMKAQLEELGYVE